MEDLFPNNIPVIRVLHEAFPDMLPPLALLSSFSSLWGWNNPWEERVYSGSVLPPCMWQQNLFLGAEEVIWEGCVRSLHLDNGAEMQSQGLDTRMWEGQRRVTENRRSFVHTLPVEVQGWESRKRGTCLSWRIPGSRGGKNSLCPFPPRGFLQRESRKNPKTDVPWP